MGIFGNNKAVEQLRDVIKTSFQRVKEDSQTTNQWLQYFYYQYQQQQHTITALNNQVQSLNAKVIDLNKQITYIPKTRTELRNMIDQYYNIDAVKAELADLNVRVDNFVEAQTPILEKLEQISQPQKSSQSQFRERVIKKITKNSKEYVRGLVLDMISKYGRISALQLREMFVEEQQLCSKSSFYRILDEIEKTQAIKAYQQGKEKIFVQKVSSVAD